MGVCACLRACLPACLCNDYEVIVLNTYLSSATGSFMNTCVYRQQQVYFFTDEFILVQVHISGV